MSVHTKQGRRSSIAKKAQSKWQQRKPWETHVQREPGGDHPRGSVWVFKEGKALYTGEGKLHRPFLIVSDNVSNEKSDQVIVVALSEQIERQAGLLTIPLQRVREADGLINGDSVVVCRSIFTVKKDDLFRRYALKAKVSPTKMQEIDACLKKVLGIS